MTRSVNSKPVLVLTCEHATAHIPDHLRPLFAGADDVLATHRGYDIGALGVAQQLAAARGLPLFATSVSRLVVDNNRSKGHPRILSEFTRDLPASDRARLFELYYTPHRDVVERTVRTHVESGRHVVHLAVHSFTPVLNGKVRNVEVGLLYDPARAAERHIVDRWHAAFRAARPDWRIRRNSPYRGTSDALCTWLRRRFPDTSYAGVELELNQGLFADGDDVATPVVACIDV
jgi:predicted N-formylglutamate amidohydrolase